MARRSSPYGSLTARHSVSNTIVERLVLSNPGQSARPGWLGFPVRAKDTHASAMFLASGYRSAPRPVMNVQLST